MFNSIFVPTNYFLNPYAIPYFVVGILVFVEGVFVFLQDRKSLVNLAYLLSNITAGIWLIGLGSIYSANNEAISLLWARYFSFLGIIFVTPAVYFFSISWKKRLSASLSIEDKLVIVELRKKTKIALFNFACAIIFYFLCINSKLFIKGIWQYPWGFYPKAGSVYIIFIIWFYLVMAASMLNFIDVYRKEKIPIKKKQAKLMIIAFSIAFLGSIEFLPNYGFALYLFAFLPVLIYITIVGYCVIHYKLMDIETVAHKTIAWFFSTLVLTIPFIGLIFLTRSWYLAFDNLGVFSFLGALSLLFLFFVRAFQPKIDHVFQRRRFDIEEIASRFVEDLVHLKGINKLIELIEDTIVDTLYPQRVDIFIYTEDERNYKLVNMLDKSKGIILDTETGDSFLLWLTNNNKIVYKEFVDLDPKYSSIKEKANDYFNLTGSIVAIPLVLNDKLLGIINLGKKSNLRRYSALDFHFLTILKNESTIAISNSLLYENIEEQVRQKTKKLVDVQRQLIQAEKLATVGTLAGGVAHEINNPLTAILTNTQMLLATSGAVDAELTKESLELIEEATKRCRTIVKKLMTFARKPLESTTISKVNLLDVLSNVLSFVGYQLKQDNIKIITKIKEDAYLVMGNDNEFEQVVTNLILNAKDAIKQTKKSGAIYVFFSKSDDWIKMKIKDEGAGIAKELIPRLFDPFFTTKDVGKGLGLGLSICQAIVEKNNGLISVESGPNNGTTFTVQLPRAKEESTVKGGV